MGHGNFSHANSVRNIINKFNGECCIPLSLSPLVSQYIREIIGYEIITHRDPLGLTKERECRPAILIDFLIIIR